jgi:hypothetical protein
MDTFWRILSAIQIIALVGTLFMIPSMYRREARRQERDA